MRATNPLTSACLLPSTQEPHALISILGQRLKPPPRVKPTLMSCFHSFYQVCLEKLQACFLCLCTYTKVAEHGWIKTTMWTVVFLKLTKKPSNGPSVILLHFSSQFTFPLLIFFHALNLQLFLLFSFSQNSNFSVH